MRILFLNTNTATVGRSRYAKIPPPSGPIALAGELLTAGHEVVVEQLHAHMQQQDEAELPLISAEMAKLLQRHEPDVVALATRNFGASRRPDDSSQMAQYLSAYYDARVARAVRQTCNLPVILGGPGFTLEPELYLQLVRPNHAVVGEAERALPRLLAGLENGQPMAPVPGVVSLSDGVFGAVPRPQLVEDWATCAVGAPEAVPEGGERYASGGGQAPVQSKRGCPFTCVYCTAPLLEGRRYRKRRPEDVVRQIEKYRTAWGAREIRFVDATFNHPPDHAMAVCEALIAAGNDVPWTADLVPQAVSERLITLMMRAGCIGVSIGVDACTEATLEAYGKPFGLGEVESCLALLRSKRLPFLVSLILGGPGQTEENLRQSLDWCHHHLADDPVAFHTGMWIDRQTPLWDLAADEGVVDRSRTWLDDVTNNSFALTRSRNYYFPHLDARRRAALMVVIAKETRRPRWLRTSLDFAPDHASGELRLSAEFEVDSSARPYWAGIVRRAGTAEAGARPGGDSSS